ncbi:MAG: DUF3450 domain-containing protein [Desulfuromonas sp.]|nr:DUF3450 domain-containing protein [Desulfuromonas sp.]
MNSVCLLLCAGSAMAQPVALPAQPFSDQVTTPVAQTLKVRQQAQREADAWQAERLKLSAELERLELEQQQLSCLCDDLQQHLDERTLAIAALQRAIAESKRLTDEMLPFLQQSVDQLRQQVAEDLPFLVHERQLRLQRLQQALDDDTVAIGEKFRRTMEALRVETEYGRSVEVIQATLTVDGRSALMNQLRVGRLALFAQSLDGQRSAIYDPVSEQWQLLAGDVNGELQRAIDMGSKHRPVDLLSLPLGKVVAQ